MNWAFIVEHRSACLLAGISLHKYMRSDIFRITHLKWAKNSLAKLFYHLAIVGHHLPHTLTLDIHCLHNFLSAVISNFRIDISLSNSS